MSKIPIGTLCTRKNAMLAKPNTSGDAFACTTERTSGHDLAQRR
jgi:hypothetical protein